MENPTTYYVFYDLFLRAVEGEEKWKKIIMSPANAAQKIATPLNESFCLIVLKNNYFAWLLDYKQGHPELKTDYDSENLKADGSDSVAQYIISGICMEAEDDTYHIIPNNRKGMADYEMAETAYQHMTQRVREKAATSEEYLQMMEALKDLESSEDDQSDEKERRRKKRKLQKDLRLYTGTRLGKERAYKGWSARAHKDQSDYKKAIEEQQRKYDGFDREYRRLTQINRKVVAADCHDNHSIDNAKQEMRRISDEMFQLPEGMIIL